MDEPLEKNFAQRMRDVLQKQLSEFEAAKEKARIVSNGGARRWRELKDSLMRLVGEINDGLDEGILTYPQNTNDNEFTLMHELRQQTMQVTFDPASAVISYQGNGSSGKFGPRVKKNALEYGWENTSPSELASALRNPRRAIRFENDEPKLEGDDPQKAFSTKQMSEILIHCIVVGPVREPLEAVEGLD
jgi:hypothetical protein